MLEKVVFSIALSELSISCLIAAVVLKQQLNALRDKTDLQRLKWLLIASVVFLVIAIIPLMFVYANAIWFNIQGAWIVNVAVLTNATSKVVAFLMLYFIYRFKE